MAKPPPDVAVAVRRGARLFNLGRYLSAQEVWETAWHTAEGDDRGFLEGLVQVAAGLHLRTRRGATRGAVHLLSQSLVLLDDHRGGRHGVDVEGLVGGLGEYVEWIRGLARPHRFLDRRRIPRIGWT
jgi:predicted metal-dependent hydrolase